MANSLKDMLTSVDWGKMFSSRDAKNALIGSALGGILMGGAGMLADRDPEESRFAPVGDALLGALLGGVAGYGIPKGLAMFRNSGSLAPDNDKLKTNYLGWGAAGEAAGAGAFGLTSVRKTLADKADKLEAAAQADLPRARAHAENVLARARASGRPQSVIDSLEQKTTMYKSDQEANALLDKLRSERGDHLLHGRFKEALKIHRRIGGLKRVRSAATRGYSGLGDLFHQVGLEADQAQRPGFFDMLLRPKKKWWPKINDVSHYHTGPAFWGAGPRVKAWQRAGMRAGKYGIPLALGAMLLHKILGPSSSDNIK